MIIYAEFVILQVTNEGFSITFLQYLLYFYQNLFFLLFCHQTTYSTLFLLVGEVMKLCVSLSAKGSPDYLIDCRLMSMLLDSILNGFEGMFFTNKTNEIK
jgi:hypothetical protein